MRIITALATGTLLFACGGERTDAEGTDDAAPAQNATSQNATAEGRLADTLAQPDGAGGVSARMRHADGRELGTLQIAETGEGLSISGRLTGLAPGPRAIHVHAVGRCEGPEFTTAGGHWNPSARRHGTDNADGPHFGDLPNMSVRPDSSVTVGAAIRQASLRGTNALLDADGAAIVIHENGDDYKSDPAGNAGKRIACGTVESR